MNKPIRVVHIISGGDSGGAKTHVLDLQSSLFKKIDSSIITFIDGPFYKDFLEAGQDITLFQQSNRFDLSVISKILDYIKTREITIVHCHGARANFLGTFLKMRMPSLPIITTIHSDYELDDFRGHKIFTYLYRGLNKFCIKRLDYHIGVSKAFKQMLLDRNIGTINTVFEVYNGQDFHVDPKITLSKEDFLKKHEVPLIEGELLVGIMGRLDPVKGHEVFIKMADYVLKQGCKVRFLVAGVGSLSKDLEKQAIATGFGDRIHFLGWINTPFNFYNVLDINTATSHSESFPYMILEASRLKLPTVSTDVGGVSDIIIDNKTGLLAADGDYEALGSKLLEMVQWPEKRTLLGNNLYDYARDNFSVEKLADDHISIYDKVINGKKAFIIGYYGSDNTGDDILLDSTITLLKGYKNPMHISVLTYKKEQIQKKHNIKDVGRNKFFLLYKEIKHADVLIGGGGSMLQNVTSNRSLIYYLALFSLGIFFKKKIVLLGNGFGPLSGSFFRRITRNFLDKVDLILIRDEKSKQLLDDIGVKNNSRVTCDIAYNLEHRYSTEISSEKSVVISLRPWDYKPSFLEEIGKTADFLVEQGYLVNFVSMQYPQDFQVCEEALAHMKQDLTPSSGSDVGSRVNIIDTNLEEITGAISRADFVIGMRLHTLILAGIFEKPIIGIEYDPKVAAYIQNMGQQNAGTVHTLTATNTIDLVENIENNYTTYKAHVVQQNKAIYEKADENKQALYSFLDTL